MIGREVFEQMVAAETDECILWPHGRSGKGYGVARFGDVQRTVHVVAAELAYGPRPPGMDVAHSCRNRHCFNPRHLSYKTRKGNASDMLRDGTDPSGERNGHARLSWDDVRAIRASKEVSRVEAEKYGVSPRHIRGIREGRYWRGAA